MLRGRRSRARVPRRTGTPNSPEDLVGSAARSSGSCTSATASRDVPRSQPFYKKIETLLHNGITTGCTATQYCPGDRRLARPDGDLHRQGHRRDWASSSRRPGTVGASAYNCSPGGHSLFTDVAPTDSFCKHVHYLAAQNVTLGCDATQYCPGQTDHARRDGLLHRQGGRRAGRRQRPSRRPTPIRRPSRSYSCVAGSPNLHFTDVPVSNAFCKHIHYLWAKGIVDGCTATTVLPRRQPVARDAMAKFIANGFGLQLYGALGQAGSDGVQCRADDPRRRGSGGHADGRLDGRRASGSASDDGLPDPRPALTHQWTQVSGPTVTFNDATALSTTAHFPQAALYVLRLSASDGLLSSFDDVSINVNPTGGVPADPGNFAPPLDPGVATDVATSTAFLYTGPDPIPDRSRRRHDRPAEVRRRAGTRRDAGGDAAVGREDHDPQAPRARPDALPRRRILRHGGQRRRHVDVPIREARRPARSATGHRPLGRLRLPPGRLPRAGRLARHPDRPGLPRSVSGGSRQSCDRCRRHAPGHGALCRRNHRRSRAAEWQHGACDATARAVHGIHRRTDRLERDAGRPPAHERIHLRDRARRRRERRQGRRPRRRLQQARARVPGELHTHPRRRGRARGLLRPNPERVGGLAERQGHQDSRIHRRAGQSGPGRQRLGGRRRGPRRARDHRRRAPAARLSLSGRHQSLAHSRRPLLDDRLQLAGEVSRPLRAAEHVARWTPELLPGLSGRLHHRL